MRSKKRAALILASMVIPAAASANSSWIWLSETRPFDVLPIVALITIFVETLILWLALGRSQLRKISVVVAAANLLSFAAPYLVIYGEIFSMRVYPFWTTLERGPYYTIGGVYLFMTLAIELPVTYGALRKQITQPKAFGITAILVNVVTTLITAAVERLCCYGHW